MLKMEPKTALAKTLAKNPDAALQLMADFALGSFEGVVLEGVPLLNLKCQRLLVAVRGADGRTTTFALDIPLEADSEAGAHVYRDVRGS